MTSIRDYFNAKLLEKAEAPFKLRLDVMNEFRDIAVQAAMYSFVSKEANSPDKIEDATRGLDEIASTIAKFCPEFLILSRHWKDIQKYPRLQQWWSKRKAYKQYKRALKRNNNRYSSNIDTKEIVKKIVQYVEIAIGAVLRQEGFTQWDDAWEAIQKAFTEYARRHSLMDYIKIKEYFDKINEPDLTDEEILITPKAALLINPFSDLFWVTVCQIFYIKEAYKSYMLKQLSEPSKARPYLWLGTIQVHLTDGTNDYVIKKEEKKKTNRQKVKVSTSEIISTIAARDETAIISDFSMYIDHEGVKTNLIKDIGEEIEKSLLDGQPSFTNTNFDYWCLCPPGSLCDEWRSPYILDIEGFFYNPVVECWSTNNQAKPYLQFTFEWEKKQRVLAITKFTVQPSKNVKIRINYEIKKEVDKELEWVEAGYTDVQGELIDKWAILPEGVGARITVETIESKQNPLTLTFYGATVMKVKI